MSTTRRMRRTERFGRITDAAVAAFKAGDVMELHRELRLPPWQVSPLRAQGECPWPENSAAALTWADSVALLEVLSGDD